MSIVFNALDRLPIELLHYLFDYLSAYDVLSCLGLISSYLESAVSTYRFRIDFKSIPKSHFDFLCSHLDFFQIISLRLSDHKDTDGQISLFLKSWIHFHPQLTHLQSLSLYKINLDDLHQIEIQLSYFQRLTTLSIVCFPTSDTDFYLAPYLSLHSLKRLIIQTGSSNILLPSHSVVSNIEHLTLEIGKIDINLLFNYTPRLRSLDINTQTTEQWNSLVLPIDLTSFSIRKASIGSIDRIFSEKYMNLKRLRLLNVSLESDSWNGAKWENWICVTLPNLKIFQFDFHLSNNTLPANEIIIRSFQTPFYLVEKQWYVILDQLIKTPLSKSHLYTVPLCDTQCYFLQEPPFTSHSTLPYNHLLSSSIYSNVNEIWFDRFYENDTNSSRYYFPKIKILHMKHYKTLNKISSIIDLTQVSKLLLRPRPSWTWMTSSIAQFMPNLTAFKVSLPLSQQNNFFDISMPRIRRLKLYPKIDLHTDIKILYELFPNIQYLNFTYTDYSSQDLIDSIDYLIKQLTNLTSLIVQWQYNEPTIEKVYKWYTKYLNNSIVKLNNSEFQLRIWIARN